MRSIKWYEVKVMDWEQMKKKVERTDLITDDYTNEVVRPVLLEIIKYLESKDLTKRIACIER